jgi:hypothetical protein
MQTTAPTNERVVDRKAAIQAYLENRGRTQALFDLLEPDLYYQRPIPLRHPTVFYEGHVPAFSVNCFRTHAQPTARSSTRSTRP